MKKNFFDSIRMKLIAIMVLSILPLNLLYIMSTYQSLSAIQDKTASTLESAANLYMQQLENSMFAINYYFHDLYEHDADLIRMTQERGDDSYVLSQTVIARKLGTNIETTFNADGYFLYSEKLDDLLLVMPDSSFSGGIVQPYAVRGELEEWLQRSELSGLPGWRLVEVRGKQWLMYVYTIDTFHIGAVISMDAFYWEIKEAMDYSRLEVAVNTENGEIKKRWFLSAHSTTGKTDFTLHIFLPDSEANRGIPPIQWYGIILAFAYLLLVPALFIILSRILLKPLHRIRDALLRLKTGAQDYRISMHDDSSEFRSINQSFNEMADNIQHLKIENYENELAKREMEYQNLQLQIRPHFLLNIFKLVYSLAQIKEYQSIQKFALYLSSYFRHLFRSTEKLVYFEQEYSLIREYIKISEIRYPDRFSVRYQVDEGALSVKVPPLLIHNFVENIFNHALVSVGTIHIELIARYKDGWATFIVSDDGAGMDHAVADRINKGVFATEEGDRVHVGIYNSYQRLRHSYGEQSVLEVASEPREGTSFTVRFPYHKEENINESIGS